MGRGAPGLKPGPRRRKGAAALDRRSAPGDAHRLADIISIDDPLDPRIAPFREVRERDLAGRRNGFIAEGEVVLNVLARSLRHRARALLPPAQPP